MTEFEALKNGVLQECDDDHVGLWSVVRDVRDRFPEASDAEIQSTTLALLAELLADRLIVAGRPTADGRGFVGSSETHDSILEQIRTEWESLGRVPSIGEMIWFTAPTRKRAATKSLK